MTARPDFERLDELHAVFGRGGRDPFRLAADQTWLAIRAYVEELEAVVDAARPIYDEWAALPAAAATHANGNARTRST